jgi:hypothetical protein
VAQMKDFFGANEISIGTKAMRRHQMWEKKILLTFYLYRMSSPYTLCLIQDPEFCATPVLSQMKSTAVTLRSWQHTHHIMHSLFKIYIHAISELIEECFVEDIYYLYYNVLICIIGANLIFYLLCK